MVTAELTRNPTDYIVDEAVSLRREVTLTQYAVSNSPEGETSTKEYDNRIAGIDVTPEMEEIATKGYVNDHKQILQLQDLTHYMVAG